MFSTELEPREGVMSQISYSYTNALIFPFILTYYSYYYDHWFILHQDLILSDISYLICVMTHVAFVIGVLLRSLSFRISDHRHSSPLGTMGRGNTRMIVPVTRGIGLTLYRRHNHMFSILVFK